MDDPDVGVGHTLGNRKAVLLAHLMDPQRLHLLHSWRPFGPALEGHDWLALHQLDRLLSNVLHRVCEVVLP